jgi:hypothetical protein
VKDPEEPCSQSLVDGGKEHEHHRHRSVEIPVRNRPALFDIHAQALFVGLCVALEIGGLVRQRDYDDRWGPVVAVFAAAWVGDAPELRELLGPLEHDELEPLGKAGRRRMEPCFEDPIEDLRLHRFGRELPHHAPSKHDIAKLHDILPAWCRLELQETLVIEHPRQHRRRRRAGGSGAAGTSA